MTDVPDVPNALGGSDMAGAVTSFKIGELLIVAGIATVAALGVYAVFYSLNKSQRGK